MRRRTLLIVTLAFAVAACWSHVRAAKVSMPETAARADGTYAPPIPSPTSSRKMDEYGDIRWSDERERLDYFTIEMGNDPTAVGYIMGYAGRVARAGEARRRIERAKNYLVSVRKIDPRNVVTIDGGHREELTVELWILPRGARPPAANPTVDPSEVRFIKSTPKAGARRRSTRRGRADLRPRAH